MKILIRLPNWLGDVVMSTAFINAVRQLYSDAEIDIILKKELIGIASLIPGLRAIHPFSKNENKGLMSVYRFGKALRNEKYDLFFNLPTSLSSSVLAWATKSKKLIGFKETGGALLYTKAFKKPANVHRVNEYLSLLEQYTNKKITEIKVALKVDKPGAKDNKLVLINFNSEASSRRMPLDKAKTLIKTLSGTFTNTTFAFIGSSKETPFVQQIIEGMEHNAGIKNLAGTTDLIGLSRLMASAGVILTTDSGPAHLANSVGTPTIVLFGAGNEHNTAPYNKQALTILRHGKLNCEPCVKNTCELYGVPKCMELIDELQIIQSLSLYLPHA